MKDDQGINKFLQRKFNLKNYQEKETENTDNALFQKDRKKNYLYSWKIYEKNLGVKSLWQL